MSGIATRFFNCRLLRNKQLVQDDLWVRDAHILNPENYFFQHGKTADVSIDCGGAIIVPGFIDVQINGGFGVDFSHDISDPVKGILKVAKGILSHGVTSFCPTLVSSAPHVYNAVLPHTKLRLGGTHGAQVLGAHVEGPFINKEKKGAHHGGVLQLPSEGIHSLETTYGHMDSIAIVTLAPELHRATEVIGELTKRNIVVSLGHSMATFPEGEEGIKKGARFITHLFNAMLPFHHRDPGLVGLLASDQIPPERNLFYGIIADGNHTHPSTVRIAYRANREGIVLVTDACSAMGLLDGIHHIGQQAIEVKGTKAMIQGTTTLCGSVATMISCIHYFWKTTGCDLVEALEAATLHPAQLLGIENEKGTLDFGTDADFVILSQDDLNVESTWIGGVPVYKKLANDSN